MAARLKIAALSGLALATSACASLAAPESSGSILSPENFSVRTVPVPAELVVEGGTYTPSGKILVNYARTPGNDRDIGLATVNDDGSTFREFFAGVIPERPKDNGIRYMVFPDDRRIFMGDFVLECSSVLAECDDASLVPVDYPAEVADGDHVHHRWSEMIVAPDGRSIAWTTLFRGYSAMVFTGALERRADRYVIGNVRIISSLDPFAKDPGHPDGVLPQPIRGGEVKQFIHGGTAISMAGAGSRDIPDSMVQHLGDGRMEQITETPGYTETTIFSPDETLGIVMTTRFSPQTDPAVLGLMPRPYPAALNMGLSMFAYTYAVTGVRRSRPGNVGPALIDIAASKAKGSDYRGINLSTDPDWVYHSPMSWHPDSRRATWVEGQRKGGSRRIQVVELIDREPGIPVPAAATPLSPSYAPSDLALVASYAAKAHEIDVKVYGRSSGYLTYSRSRGGEIVKTYFDYSDDGEHFYSGHERTLANLGRRSRYAADITLRGVKAGRMKLQITFDSLGGQRPSAIIFEKDADGLPTSRGFAEYDGVRLEVAELIP
jgi:hypothetical protein